MRLIAGRSSESLALRVSRAKEIRHEPFIIPMDALETGAYLVQARAADATDQIETTWASQPITITRQVYTAFLPFFIG